MCNSANICGCKMRVITFLAEIFVLLCICSHVRTQEIPPEKQQNMLLKPGEKMSDYVLKILEHYKQEDPVGLPGAPIPDPMDIPPLAHSFSVGKMNFKNVQLFGLKKFRLDFVKVDLTEMKVEAALKIEKLDVLGNYTLSTWLSRANGPFSVKLSDVYVQATAMLEVERSGQLEAQDMAMDITFKHIAMNFEGLGFFAKVFQNIMNNVGTFVFDSIKPYILKEANTNLRKDVNDQVRQLPQRFPNSISPFDQIIAEVRRKIRAAKYDPYKVADYNSTIGIFDVHMTHTWLMGISSIHRYGDIIFEVRNNTVHALLEVGTQKMEGRSNWEVSVIAGMMSRAGSVEFTVQYLRVQIALSQTMDTRNSPRLDDIQLDLGNIQVRFDGAGTADYVIEFAINVLPNLLRYQIMDALESPLKQRIQDELNRVNVEKLIKSNVDKIDNPGSLQLL